MGRQKKILILFAAIGEGHKVLAENIAYFLSEAGWEVKLHNEHKIQAGQLVNWGTKLYHFFLTQTPWIWSWLYNTQWFSNITLPLRLKVASKNFQQTLTTINEFQPDVIISTHTTASAVVAYLKQQRLFTGKFGIAFSDFHLHQYWLYEQADFYLANIAEQKEEMVNLGIAPNKIFICGITLKPKPEINAQAVKEKMEIERDEKVVLVASGSQGLGLDAELIQQLINKPKIRVIALCGKNQSAFESLSQKFAGSNATILSYHTGMEELYAICDLLITKPGGLSIAEALRWHVPILVSHLLPGQEEHNYGYLLEKAWIMPDPINLLSEALEELETSNYKQALLQNQELSNFFNSPNSVVEVLEQISH